MQTSTGNLATHADPMIGEILGGRYVVERLLDRGGMGLVYLATEIARERHVVIKMLAPHWTEDADAVARFDREGESLARLEHPNIVELFDVGRAGEQAYIAMEYIDGEPLRRYLKRKGHTTLREFGPIASQILSAVAYAHTHGIMLRDIKPSNIMLCERDGKAGFVKLLDFGLAKLVGGEDIEITKAHVVGTAGYLSPEQIRGEPIDARVDVYALGVLFFVMLTGTSPIAGDNDAAVLYNHVHGAPKRLADELPAGHEVPAGLIALVHQCLEKEADRRPEDAGAIAEALFDCLPPEALALPEATQETREAVRTYREAKLGIVSNTSTANGEAEVEVEVEVDDDDASSAEWTRPVLRKPTPSGSVPAVQAGTWKTLTEAAQAATMAKRRAAAKKGNATRVGLPAVGLVEPSDGVRRPPPAKLDPRKRLRRTGPRKIVRAAEPEPPRAPASVAAGVDATLPAGSGHVGAKARSLTRSDGSGIVRDEARPVATPQVSEALPPPTPAPVPALASPPAAPPVSRAEPAPVIVPIEVFESMPIAVERPRSSMAIFLVVGFVALAVAAAFVYVAFVHPTPASSERADHGSDPGGDPEVIESEPVEPAEVAPKQSMAVLELTVPAGARVRVDGEARDSGRLELSVGRHRIEVVAPEHERWIRDVELLAGSNPPMIVELVPATAPEAGELEPRKTKKAPRATRDETPAPAADPEPAADPQPSKAPPQPKNAPAQDEGVFMPGRSGSDDGVFLPVGKKK